MFASCDTHEPWQANVLLSPETKLTTDTVLTFQLSAERRGSLDIYATSDVGHVSYRIAEFPPSGDAIYNETVFDMMYEDEEQNTSIVTFNEQTVCVPRTSHKVAFIASALGSNVSVLPGVLITDVVLTATPCTANASPGRLRSF